MWLACYTHEEITEAVDAPQRTVSNLLTSFSEIGHLTESGKSLASHASDFEPSEIEAIRRAMLPVEREAARERQGARTESHNICESFA